MKAVKKIEAKEHNRIWKKLSTLGVTALSAGERDIIDGVHAGRIEVVPVTFKTVANLKELPRSSDLVNVVLIMRDGRTISSQIWGGSDVALRFIEREIENAARDLYSEPVVQAICHYTKTFTTYRVEFL